MRSYWVIASNIRLNSPVYKPEATEGGFYQFPPWLFVYLSRRIKSTAAKILSLPGFFFEPIRSCRAGATACTNLALFAGAVPTSSLRSLPPLQILLVQVACGPTAPWPAYLLPSSYDKSCVASAMSLQPSSWPKASDTRAPPRPGQSFGEARRRYSLSSSNAGRRTSLNNSRAARSTLGNLSNSSSPMASSKSSTYERAPSLKPSAAPINSGDCVVCLQFQHFR